MLENFRTDDEYDMIVEDIINHDEFQKTKNVNHHGMNRFDHSLRVSYIAYKIAKFLHVSYEEVARAGLLHDFFLINSKDIAIKDKINTLVNHPMYASAYSEKFFKLSDKEKDIIETHMFPIAPTRLPKYLESWIVNLVDDYVAIREELHVKRRQMCRLANTVFALVVDND